MLLGSIIGILGIADLIYLFKNITKYKQLTQVIESLSQIQHLGVCQLIKKFQNMAVGDKISNVIVKGIIKSKVLKNKKDKNILSVITSIPINKGDHLKEYIYDRIPYREVMSKSFWIRPFQKSKISFDLQDLDKLSKISVQSCKNTDISGILSQVKVFQVEYKTPANFIATVATFLDKILFLSPFKLINQIGEKISYYGIMDGQFGYVVGEAKKKSNGQIVINNPRYITKQISFLINRLSQNKRLYKYVLIFYLAIQLILLYLIGKWAYKKYGKKIKMFNEDYQPVEQNLPFHQLCIVCYSSSRSVIFKPCKHYGVCFGCYKRLGQQICPVCKEPIQGIIRVIKK